jgi:hypothetical protein
MLTQRDIQILKFVRDNGAITINQAHQMFFNSRFGRDIARKRLKKLCDIGELRCMNLENSMSNQRIYFKDKIIDTQTLLLLDIYSKFIRYGIEVLEFNNEVHREGIRPSAFVKIRHNEMEIEMFIEVEITNSINFAAYEHLKDYDVNQKIYKRFPIIVVVSDCYTPYIGEKLDVKYLNYKLDNFIEVIVS